MYVLIYTNCRWEDLDIDIKNFISFKYTSEINQPNIGKVQHTMFVHSIPIIDGCIVKGRPLNAILNNHPWIHGWYVLLKKDDCKYQESDAQEDGAV